MANLLQERILEILGSAHVSGALGEDAQRIAVLSGFPLPQVLQTRADMMGAGLLDKVDDDSVFALSALGMRVAREGAGATQSAISECPGDKLALYSRLIDLESRWVSQVQRSNLTESEKSRLIGLGGELFAHPATKELLIRAIMSVGEGS